MKSIFGIKSGVTSHSNVHIVVASEGFVAVGTLSRTRGHPLFYTLIAEDMTTGLDRGVLEVAAADRAQGKCLSELRLLSGTKRQWYLMNLPATFHIRIHFCRESCPSSPRGSSWYLKDSASGWQSRFLLFAKQRMWFPKSNPSRLKGP